ncbi:phage tail protein [Solibaculum mannosilyticum]|uniref:Tail spike domain-containing protein n=1 Tax=Solibaculum mannosilyticum TaxID=2780922 RepID=A0A7I8D1M1_9FIRM|nr:phage tail protein [Solibaculum mannosilyticum]BCI59895.1 hypothetical protein C12CBH8_05340 [Solibaculum mannosilyticum]
MASEFTLYAFDRSEQLIATLSNQTGANLLSVVHSEQLNTLSVTLQYSGRLSLFSGYYLGFYDTDDFFQLFEIKRMEEVQNGDGMAVEVYAEHVVYELLSEMVVDFTLQNATADDVVDGILSGTRWTCNSSQNFGTHTVDLTYKNALSCLNQVQEMWGLCYRPRLILEDNRVTERHIELLPRLGADVNYRFEWGKNLLEVERVTDSRNIVTALYGRGKTLTLKQLDGQPSRGQRVDFGEVQWSKPGDPADKPLGQLWVGDEEAREAYGYGQGSEQKRHRFGSVTFDLEDPADVLQATWQALQEKKYPKVSYHLRAVELERIVPNGLRSIRLGDTVQVLDQGLLLYGMTEFTAQVVDLERDYLSPINTRITLSNQDVDLESILSQLGRQQDRMLEKESVWDDTALRNGPDAPVDTSRLEGSIDLLTNQLVASGAFQSVTPLEGKGILLENTDPSSSDYGALYLGPGFLAVASDQVDGEWRWRTFGTGRGFTADELVTGTLDAALVKTGRLQSVNGETWIDLASGSFAFGGDKLALSASGDLQVNGFLSAKAGEQEISVTADSYGMAAITFLQKGNELGSLFTDEDYKFYICSGQDMVLNVPTGYSLRLMVEDLFAPNGRRGYTGAIDVGDKRLSFSCGILYNVS